MNNDRIQNKLPARPGLPYAPLPFACRWEKWLEKARREGRWWMLSAPSQSGKTTANWHYCAGLCRKGPDGFMRAAMATAREGKRFSIYDTLAVFIDGRAALRRYPRDITLAEAIVGAGVEIVIVNNAHEMDLGHWKDMLWLDDYIATALNTVPPAFVFSGIYEQVGELCLPRDKITDQIANRMRFEEVHGHDEDEIAEALEVLTNAFAPDLRGLPKKASLVYELLTKKEYDPRGTDEVSSRDLHELVRRVRAARGANASTDLKDADLEDAIRLAYKHLLKCKTQRKGKRSGKLTPALASAA